MEEKGSWANLNWGDIWWQLHDLCLFPFLSLLCQHKLLVMSSSTLFLVWYVLFIHPHHTLVVFANQNPWKSVFPTYCTKQEFLVVLLSFFLSTLVFGPCYLKQGLLIPYILCSINRMFWILAIGLISLWTTNANFQNRSEERLAVFRALREFSLKRH